MRVGQGFNPASEEKAQGEKKRAELFHCSTRREEEDGSVRKLQPRALRHSRLTSTLQDRGYVQAVPPARRGHGRSFFPFPYPTIHQLPILLAWFCLHLFQLDEIILGCECGR